MAKKSNKPTKQELGDLWAKVDIEGFGYYMLQYGPDWDLIGRMGFDVEKLKNACSELQSLERAIDACQEFVDE